MKKNIGYTLFIFLFLSCNNSKIKLKNKLLNGNWIITSVGEADENGDNTGSVCYSPKTVQVVKI